MPNWCYTDITINHDDSNKIKSLYTKINDWINSNKMENGFGTSWLGNIVLGSEIGSIDDFRCRGSISYLYSDENSITICTETAWSPMLKMWIAVVDKYLPDAEIIYLAEEPGFEIFCTNDPEYLGEYYIDRWDGLDGNHCASKEEVISVCQELLKTDETDINKLIADINCEDLDVYIHEWEYCDINDFE